MKLTIESGVSFIIPVFNAASSVTGTLNSIVNLHYPGQFQLIIVDDGSTDLSYEVIQTWISSTVYDAARIEVCLLRQDNQGEAAAVNTGLRAARHPIAAWVESDVTLDAEWLLRIFDAWQGESIAGVGGVLYPAPDDSATAKMFGYEITYKILHNSSSPNHITSANAVYRKEILDQMGLCRVDLGESSFDSEMNQRIRDAGYSLRCAKSAAAWHRFKTKLGASMRRAWWYGYRRPFVKTQVLYSFDKIIGFLAAASGLTYPALLLSPFWPSLAFLMLGLLLGAHAAYSFFLYFSFRDPVLLFAAPIFWIRNAVFILAYATGWVRKIIGSKAG